MARRHNISISILGALALDDNSICVLVLSVWGAAVAGIWGWVWHRRGRVSGGNNGKSNLRQFWKITPTLLIGPPAFGLGVYAIYKFAISDLQDAMIAAVGVFLWVAFSVIWVYVIHPRRQRN